MAEHLINTGMLIHLHFRLKKRKTKAFSDVGRLSLVIRITMDFQTEEWVVQAQMHIYVLEKKNPHTIVKRDRDNTFSCLWF